MLKAHQKECEEQEEEEEREGERERVEGGEQERREDGEGEAGRVMEGNRGNTDNKENDNKLQLSPLTTASGERSRGGKKSRAARLPVKDTPQSLQTVHKSKMKRKRLRASLAEPAEEEEEGWVEEDDDFKVDILSSARKAAIGSGSGRKARGKLNLRSRRKKIQRHFYSSEEEEEEEEGEEEGREVVPAQRFTFSDDDDWDTLTASIVQNAAFITIISNSSDMVLFYA